MIGRRTAEGALGANLHVEDLVGALRLARDVADLVGGLGGQRGGGVAVDRGVAERTGGHRERSASVTI